MIKTKKIIERVAVELYYDDPITNFRVPIPWEKLREDWLRDKYRRRAEIAIDAVLSTALTQVGAE